MQDKISALREVGRKLRTAAENYDVDATCDYMKEFASLTAQVDYGALDPELQYEIMDTIDLVKANIPTKASDIS